MTKMLTLRLDDRSYDELTAIARANGTSLSETARTALLGLLNRPDDDSDDGAFIDVPNALTTVERTELALLHRILARLVDDKSDEGDFASQIAQAEILERGYVAEYGDIFGVLDPELSRRESGLVMDILDMFTQLEWSYGKLRDADRTALGEWAEEAAQFSGFDANHRLEGRLLTYARHLIERGKWKTLAGHFDVTNDHGNSHYPTIEKYERMLEEFNPIWRDKLRNLPSGGRESRLLTAAEIRQVIGAAIHPDKRK